LLQREGEVLVVALAGAVDYTTIHTMRGALGEAFADARAHTVIVDLSEVEFLGSAGIAALVDAAGAQRDRAAPALRVVVDDSRPVVRPIQLTGLDDVLALYRTREDALRDAGRWSGSRRAAPDTSR
jgi:anti-sigma B factor antagonist